MIHGGDIYRNRVKIDFSVNLNPLGASDSIIKSLDGLAFELDRYPDYKSEELTGRLAALWKMDAENLIIGNGASELIMAVVHALKPENALVTAPSFSGYRHALEAGGVHTDNYYLSDEFDFCVDEGLVDYIGKTDGLNLIIISNPNNPVGNYINGDLLERIIIKCREKNIFVLLDECFMELSDDRSNSLVDKIKIFDNLLILRAFTKTFAIPALRLGYLTCGSTDALSEIKKHLPEWNVSLAAQKAGVAAIDDYSYLENSRRIIMEERTYIKKELEAIGIRVYPSDTVFLLLKTDIPIYDMLLDKGILIRDCSDFEGLEHGYYRIAVKQHKENEMLINAIREIAAAMEK